MNQFMDQRGSRPDAVAGMEPARKWRLALLGTVWHMHSQVFE
jgi:hypothetical protein